MSGLENVRRLLPPADPRGGNGPRPRLFMMTNDFQVGGSERQFTTLARAFEMIGWPVRLGCLRRRGSLLRGFEDVAEFDVGGSFFSPQAIRAGLALGGHLRRLGVAIAHSFDFYSNLILIPAARYAGVPVVVGSQRQLGNLLRPTQRAGQRAVFGLCDSVVCNSEAAARSLLAMGLSEGKVALIPNALPDEAFQKACPALPRRPEVLRVGMVARMNHPVKNHAMLLRAFARLSPRFPAVELVLAGDGPLRPDLEKLAQGLGLDSRVNFLGERDDIPAVLAALDISVLPSSSESLANAILESMAAGLPVVAARVGGNPEIVREGETGFLVPPDDEDRLVEALERLLLDGPLRSECGGRARRFAEANFPLEKVRDRFVRLYEGLMAAKRSTARLQGWARGSEVVSRPAVRVAIVAPSPRWIGGQGAQANLLARHWQGDRAVEVQLIPIDPELPRWLAWVERVPYLRTAVREPFYLAALWRGMEGAHIVHIFSASYWSFLLAPTPALLVAKLRRKATLINYHSGEAGDHLRHWRTALPVLRRVDGLVVPSQYLLGVFREFGLEAAVVPNIVDLGQFRYQRRHPLRPLLVCTRGFHPYYRVDDVIRAFGEVQRQFPEARLWLVGKGPLEQEMRELVRKLKLANVEFTGPVPHDEIGRFYDQADIFVNASCLDNMPVSILEAFAAGTPVVSTAAGGVRYLVEHERTGLLCEPGDWRALARNIARVLQDPALAASLASNAHEETHRYCWKAVRAQWLQVYKSVAKLAGG